MIKNVPASEDLRIISLRLFFNAWSSVSSIVTDYVSIVGTALNAEWEAYAEASQNELQGTYTLILQSQEIGLKAKIAEVSPYLLLKRLEAKPIGKGGFEYDFSDFPTIDAGELVRVHNITCATPVSEAFAERFEALRRGRNKIAHLGLFNEKLDPFSLIALLFKQYVELYPGRSWLPDRLHFVSHDRWSGFEFASADGWNPIGAVLSELWEIQAHLTPEQHAIVFGQPVTKERHVCPSCALDLMRHQGGNEPYPGDVPTASKHGLALICSLCDQTHEVREQACVDKDCPGHLVPLNVEYGDMCTTCGRTPDEI